MSTKFGVVYFWVILFFDAKLDFLFQILIYFYPQI